MRKLTSELKKKRREPEREEKARGGKRAKEGEEK